MGTAFFFYPDGSRTQVTTPDPPASPLVVSAITFQDTCETGFGGGAPGRARFGALVRAMRDSLDDEVLAVFKRYEASTTFDKPKVAALLTLLVAKGVASLTAGERTAILAAWPEG